MPVWKYFKSWLLRLLAVFHRGAGGGGGSGGGGSGGGGGGSCVRVKSFYLSEHD